MRIVVDPDHFRAELKGEERRDPARAAGDVEKRPDIGPEPGREFACLGRLEPTGLPQILVEGLCPNARLHIRADRRVRRLVERGLLAHKATVTGAPAGASLGPSGRLS